MTDSEKVIEILEKAKTVIESWVPMFEQYNTPAGIDYVITMLKAQEPRVMTPADVNNIGPEDVCAFVEIREETHMYACYMRQYDETHTEIMCDVPNLPTKIQNGCARIWTSRPTDEQRKAVKWDE